MSNDNKTPEEKAADAAADAMSNLGTDQPSQPGD